MRVTRTMADALGMTIEINGRRAMIGSRPNTQAALARRGLADEFGYLTIAGQYIAYLYGNGCTRRTWGIENLTDDAVKWSRGRARDAARAEEMTRYGTMAKVVVSLIPNGRNVARNA